MSEPEGTERFEIKRIEKQPEITLTFEVTGAPVVRDESTGQAVYASNASVEMRLTGEIARAAVRGRSLHAPADWRFVPDSEITLFPEEFDGAGRLALALVAAARAAWEAGSAKPTQAHEQPKLHEAVLDILRRRGRSTSADLRKILPGEPYHLSPSETTLRRALNLMQEHGVIQGRVEQIGNGKPTVWALKGS